MDRGDLPYDVHINVGVIVGDDVSHPSHFPKRQFRNGAPGFFVQVGGGFTDDFDPPDHRILFLRVGPEIRLGCVLHIRCDQARCLQNVPQSPELVSFHKRGPQWREYAREQSGWAISRERDVAQNPLEHLPVPLPPRPFRADRRSTSVMTRQALPASPHHCQVRPARVRRNRIAPAGEYDVSCKTVAIAVVALPKRACGDSFACPEGRRVIAFDQGGYDDHELPCSGVLKSDSSGLESGFDVVICCVSSL